MVKGQQMKIYRCVIGEILSMPNELVYLQAISNRKFSQWIGHCKGDSIHKEHLVVVKKTEKWQLLHAKTDAFKKPNGKTFAKRLFPRQNFLRCLDGKCQMNIQRKATRELGIETVDIFKCTGNFRFSGHEEHLIKIQHGTLGVNLKKEEMGVLIVSLESD